MTLQLEAHGIPAALISAIPSIPLSLGVPRVVLGVAVTHLLGDPLADSRRERVLRRLIVDEALNALQTDVARPTLFRPPGL